MNDKLDLYDKKILYELDINSRISAAKIGKKLKIPKETINYRIKRLEQEKWIDRFYTIFNASLFGYSYYRVFLKFDKIITAIKTEIINYITTAPSCANLRILEGYYELSFLTIHKNPGELKTFLRDLFNRYGKVIQEKSILLLVRTFKLNQKFLFDGKTIQKTFDHFDIKDYILDKIDLGIIKAISNNARIKLCEISKQLRVDSRLIEYHKRKMEQSGVIFAYTTALNRMKIKRELIKIDIALKNPAVIPQIIDFFDKTNTCIFAHESIGKYDLSMEIYVENDEMLREILEKFQEQFLENYGFYDVSHVYKEYVLNWSPFDI